jgi:hypothetical protein
MKIILILTLSLFILPFCSFSQTNQEKISKYLVSILRDSLNLSDNQVQNIYKMNLTLEEQKNNVRSMEDLIDNKRKKVQKIENSRDSLYATVLNPIQFEAYKNRKSSLLNVNMPTN